MATPRLQSHRLELDTYLPKIIRNRKPAFHGYAYGPIARFPAIKFNQQKQAIKAANRGIPVIWSMLARDLRYIVSLR
jgi:hypothetical protein